MTSNDNNYHFSSEESWHQDDFLLTILDAPRPETTVPACAIQRIFRGYLTRRNLRLGQFVLSVVAVALFVVAVVVAVAVAVVVVESSNQELFFRGKEIFWRERLNWTRDWLLVQSRLEQKLEHRNKIRTSRLKIFAGLKSRARELEHKLELEHIRTVM